MMRANVHQDLLLVERSCQVLGTDASVNLAVPPGELLEACAALEDCLAWQPKEPSEAGGIIRANGKMFLTRARSIHPCPGMLLRRQCWMKLN